MKTAILETVQKKQLILFLSYFSGLLKRKARQFRFFYWPFNFCPHSLHYVSRWENHLGHSCSLLRVRGGGGGLPEHFRMEYTMVLPTSSFITIFLVSPFGRGFCFNFLDPGIQPRSRKKKSYLGICHTTHIYSSIQWMSPSHPLHKKVLSWDSFPLICVIENHSPGKTYPMFPPEVKTSCFQGL